MNITSQCKVVLFKNLKEIAPLAIFGIATSILVVVVVVVFSFMLYPIQAGSHAVISPVTNASGTLPGVNARYLCPESIY